MYGKADVYIFPGEVWDYIKSNMSRLFDVDIVIAESEKGVEVVARLDPKDNCPLLSVCDNGRVIEEERIISQTDAAVTARRLFAKYFGSGEEEPDEEEVEDEIVYETQDPNELDLDVIDRENELYRALGEFLEVVCPDVLTDGTDSQIDEILDVMLSVVADAGFQVYRPCYMDIGDEEMFIEYPYNTASTNKAV